MSFDNTKYHCEINTVPYQIRGYQKSELSTFIPRLGSGDQEESDFDLLRSKTIKGFDGGSLQRFWKEDNSVFAVEGMYPVFDDGALYPVNEIVNDDTGIIGSSKAVMTAYCVTNDYVYVASRTYNSPTNRIMRINKSGTKETLTIPTNLRDASSGVTSMVVWGTAIMITCGVTSFWASLLSTTAVADLTNGSNTQFSDCEYVIVGDDEIDSHLSGGWHRTPTEAGAHKPSAAPDPERAQAEALAARNAADAQAIAGVRAWAGRATLEAKARELGLKFDGRTSDKRLQAMIEAA